MELEPVKYDVPAFLNDLVDDLPVVSRRIAVIFLVTRSAAIGGVALNDGTVHLEYVFPFLMYFLNEKRTRLAARL